MLAAEAAGTFFLTFVAVGADVVDAASGGEVGHVGRYLAPGFIVTAMIYSLSGVSGAHINPAVTLAFAIRRTITAGRAALYVVAQLVGATCAALAVAAMFPMQFAHGVSQTRVGAPATTMLAWETTLTLLLVFVILSTAEEQVLVGKNAAIAIGFTVAACGLFSSPVSGASMNPARSIGPAVASGDFSAVWIYVLGPCVGASLATFLVRAIHGMPSEDEARAARGDERAA